MYILNENNNPNASEYAMIAFLEGQDLTYGYGDYWDANLITYLSKGDITLAPVKIADDRLNAHRWYSALRWYNAGTDYFVLVRNDRTEEIGWLRNHTPGPRVVLRNVTSFGNAWIFSFTEIPE